MRRQIYWHLSKDFSRLFALKGCKCSKNWALMILLSLEEATWNVCKYWWWGTDVLAPKCLGISGHILTNSREKTSFGRHEDKHEAERLIFTALRIMQDICLKGFFPGKHGLFIPVIIISSSMQLFSLCFTNITPVLSSLKLAMKARCTTYDCFCLLYHLFCPWPQYSQ